jgi:hypothetical protein
MNHWTDPHITSEEWAGKVMYYGWDETGADTVCVSTDRDAVVKAMVEYAEQLNHLHATSSHQS